jgi:hypothetical protein
MQHVRHALSAAVIAAVIAAGTAACGSSPKSTASSDPLARLTAGKITERALADMNNAASLRFAGSGRSSGKTVALALTLVRGYGCKGSISLQGNELRMIYNGKSVWMLPSDAFYKMEGVNPAAISLVSGKWLKVQKSDFSGLSGFCSLSGLVHGMTGHYGEMTKGTPTTVDGQRVVTIHQAGQSGAAYISDSAKPELLELHVTKGSTTGTFTFSAFGAPVTITPPPAREIFDGSKLGL